jgi:hypothetical protein
VETNYAGHTELFIIFTHIKDMINFVNLSRLITNDKSAGEASDVKIMSKNIPLSGSLLDLDMVNFVISRQRVNYF